VTPLPTRRLSATWRLGLQFLSLFSTLRRVLQLEVTDQLIIVLIFQDIITGTAKGPVLEHCLMKGLQRFMEVEASALEAL
jgi:protein tyrosine/serine phosphatase